MIRGPCNNLTQVIHRLSEMDHANSRPELCLFEHKDGNLVVLVENFLFDGEIEYIAGKEYRCKEPFFMYPFDSRELQSYQPVQESEVLSDKGKCTKVHQIAIS